MVTYKSNAIKNSKSTFAKLDAVCLQMLPGGWTTVLQVAEVFLWRRLLYCHLGPSRIRVNRSDFSVVALRRCLEALRSRFPPMFAVGWRIFFALTLSSYESIRFAAKVC